MAIRVTATPGLSTTGVPRVQVDVEWTTAPVPASVRVYRVESQVRTGVRQADPLLLSAGVGVAFDYEAPTGVDVTYVAVLEDGTASPESAPCTPVDDGSAWLVHAGLPELSVRLLVSEWPTWSRTVPQGRFEVLGRAAPVVTSGRRQAGQGTLTALTLSAADGDRLRLLLADGTPLLLRGSAVDGAGSRWVAVGDTTEKPHARNVRDLITWTLPLQVVDAPSGAALAAITYSTTSAYFATYGDTLIGAPTYTDRSAGDWYSGSPPEDVMPRRCDTTRLTCDSTAGTCDRA